MAKAALRTCFSSALISLLKPVRLSPRASFNFKNASGVTGAPRRSIRFSLSDL